MDSVRPITLTDTEKLECLTWCRDKLAAGEEYGVCGLIRRYIRNKYGSYQACCFGIEHIFPEWLRREKERSTNSRAEPHWWETSPFDFDSRIKAIDKTAAEITRVKELDGAAGKNQTFLELVKQRGVLVKALTENRTSNAMEALRADRIKSEIEKLDKLILELNLLF